MTPEKLNELERLEKAATPGPWRHHKAPTWAHVKRDGDYVLQNGFERDTKLAAELRNSAAELIADSRKLRETEEWFAIVLRAARAVVSEQQPDGSGHPEDVQDLKNALDGFAYFSAPCAAPNPSEERRP